MLLTSAIHTETGALSFNQLIRTGTLIIPVVDLSESASDMETQMEEESWRPWKSKLTCAVYLRLPPPHTSAQLWHDTRPWDTLAAVTNLCIRATDERPSWTVFRDAFMKRWRISTAQLMGKQLTLLETRWYCISGHSKQHRSFVCVCVCVDYLQSTKRGHSSSLHLRLASPLHNLMCNSELDMVGCFYLTGL